MVAYSFKKQFCPAIELGLRLRHNFDYDPDVIRPKRQTIRAVGKRRHARPGETIQLYTAMRTKQCRKLGESRCVSVEGVLLKWSEWPAFFIFNLEGGKPGTYQRIGDLREISDVEEFARSDGFLDFAAMRQFWRDEHGPQTFEGIIIKWERVNAD